MIYNSVMFKAEVMAAILVKLERRDLPGAARLLGRGMRDNPINIRAFAIADDNARERALARFFLPAMKGLFVRGEVLGAVLDDKLVGVCGLAPPHRCQPGTIEKARIAPSLLLWPATALRVTAWTGAWAKADPREPHWHLGPVAVDPSLQGGGIGSAMLRSVCEKVGGETIYLETDKPENVRFYRRFGFEVTRELRVLDIHNWFMTRRH